MRVCLFRENYGVISPPGLSSLVDFLPFDELDSIDHQLDLGLVSSLELERNFFLTNNYPKEQLLLIGVDCLVFIHLNLEELLLLFDEDYLSESFAQQQQPAVLRLLSLEDFLLFLHLVLDE